MRHPDARRSTTPGPAGRSRARRRRRACRSGTAGCRSAAAGPRRAGRSGWSSRTCRSGSARSGRPRTSSGTGRARSPRGRCPSAGRPGNDGIGSGVGPSGGAGPGSKAGVAYGVRPTSSSGGPSAASRRTASHSSPRSGGRVAVTASTAPAQREPDSASEIRSSSSPARWSRISCATALAVDGGGVLEDDAQVVGQLGVGQLEPGREVGLLEPEQRHPPLAGVAVGEVGEEQVVPTAVVEGVDVVLLELGQRRLLEAVRRTPAAVRPRARAAGGRLLGSGRAGRAAPRRGSRAAARPPARPRSAGRR